MTVPDHDEENPSSNKWLQMEPSQDWFYFMLTADKGAKLVLTATYLDDTNGYTILIGDKENTETSLWKGGA